MKRVILGENITGFLSIWIGGNCRRMRVAIRHRRSEMPHWDNVKNCIFVGVEWLQNNFAREYAEMVLADEEFLEIGDQKGQQMFDL